MTKVMFFATEPEMRECELNVLEFHRVSTGIRAVVEVDEKEEKEASQPERMCYVAAVCNGSYLYCTSGKPSFEKSMAKKFPYSVAKKKAEAMSRRGTYHWKVY